MVVVAQPLEQHGLKSCYIGIMEPGSNYLHIVMSGSASANDCLNQPNQQKRCSVVLVIRLSEYHIIRLSQDDVPEWRPTGPVALPGSSAVQCHLF